VLEALAATPDGLGIRDTSRRTGIDKSVVSRLLTQLEALSMTTKDEVQGPYHVGPRLFALSSTIVARDSLSRAARPILENLVRRFNKTCYLATRHLDTFTFSAKVECTPPIRYIIELGSTAHLHAGAAGRAILLGMPQAEARAILQTTELEQLTDRTVTDVERLLQLAAEDQTRGWWWRPEASSMGGGLRGRVQVDVRDAVRLSFRAHICGLVPPGSLAEVPTCRSGVEALVARRQRCCVRCSACPWAELARSACYLL
jgi:DNA-binding IclR family transcriptional regulator